MKLVLLAAQRFNLNLPLSFGITISPIASQYKNASAAEMENNYLLLFDSQVYVLDYSASGFTYYSSYANDEKAQKVLPWFVWDLSDTNHFRSGVDNKLLSYRGVPILHTQDKNGTAARMVFGGTEDTHYDESTNTIRIQYAPIRCMFKTKLFDFDRTDMKKKIQQLYLSVADVADCIIRVSYETEQWTQEDAYVIECTGDGENIPNGQIETWRLTPNASRVRSFGIRCEAEGYMAIQGILLKYQQQGVVR